MILSMTGFGDASGRGEAGAFFVEIRSVNNKYYKTIMRLPEALQPLEAEFEVELRHKLHRGTVTLRVAPEESEASEQVKIDAATLDRYVDQLTASEAVARGAVVLDLASLLTLPGVVRHEGDEDERLRQLRETLLPLIDRAAGRLVEMRAREGEALAEELLGLTESISVNLEQIAEKAPGVVADYERRLKSRIEILLTNADVSVDQVELIREIAVYAEKTDIAEEVTRLRGHLEQFAQHIRGADRQPIGRTLEFLTQEMLREANTIASKTPDADVSRLIVEVKGAIDRIKEQVQNVA